jgi:hypothetical protein
MNENGREAPTVESGRPRARRSLWVGGLGAVVLGIAVAAIVAAGGAGEPADRSTPSASQRASTTSESWPVVNVYKDPNCGCCTKWVDHLREHGFTVHTTDLGANELGALKASRGVPGRAESCHTAAVGDYVIEGHVPAADVQRLLRERPALVVGLAVPGMPIGSPGMEVPGVAAQPFDVLAFDQEGRVQVYERHGR